MVRVSSDCKIVLTYYLSVGVMLVTTWEVAVRELGGIFHDQFRKYC